MAAKKNLGQKTVASIVKRYLAGGSIKQMAKQHKVSTNLLYYYVRKATGKAASKAKRGKAKLRIVKGGRKAA